MRPPFRLSTKQLRLTCVLPVEALFGENWPSSHVLFDCVLPVHHRFGDLIVKRGDFPLGYALRAETVIHGVHFVVGSLTQGCYLVVEEFSLCARVIGAEAISIV